MWDFIFIYILIGVSFYIQKYNKINDGLSSLLLILPVSFGSSLLVGFRPLSAGFDTATYVAYYNSLINENFVSFNQIYAYNFQSDYLYRLWNYLIAYFGLDSSSFIYITSFVSILLFILALQKLFRAKYLLVFLLFFATPGFILLFGNGIRQGFAISFFLFSIHYFIENKKLKMLAGILATILFHQSTGVILIIALLGMKVLPKLIRKYTLFTLLILLALQPLVLYLNNFIYTIYPSSYLETAGTKYFFHYSFVLFLALFYFLSFIKKIKSITALKLFYLYCTLTIISSLVSFSEVIYGRVLYLGFPFLCFFLAYLSNLLNFKWVNHFLVVIFLFVGIYFFDSEDTQQTLTFLYPQIKIHTNSTLAMLYYF